ncbi:MAG: heparinase II/III family protein [Opitutales bacterium]|nr:heparinase II/III family protein [Opitutales bacterium]
MINRRDFFKLGSAPVLAAGMPTAARAGNGGKGQVELFYTQADLPRIRDNARTPLLGPRYRQWSAESVDEVLGLFQHANRTRNIVTDLNNAVMGLGRMATVQLVDPSSERRDGIIKALEMLVERPAWDHFREAGDKLLGIQRASWAGTVVLFARQVVYEDLSQELDQRILESIAVKVCEACYRTVYGMDNIDEVVGWGFDAEHEGFYDIDMSRWPMIIGANNLRSSPSSGLGLGALALRGVDSRSEQWLERTVESFRRVFTLFKEDGSFFEAVSYGGYTLRRAFTFFEPHERVDGSIDWAKETDLDNYLDFILASHAGYTAEGEPDIFNFGDTFGAVHPCVPAYIGNKTGNPLAQFMANHISNPLFFMDFLWYRPELPEKQPSPALDNVHTRLDWIFCRTGWKKGDAYLGFRSGGPANHEQADRNSFIYKIHGERLLNDPFRADYDWRQPRWVLRLSEAHNTVLVGGKGQQYHRGEEGVNDGLSYANVLRYEDFGHIVWWTSDASAAYRIDNYHIFKVLRTLIFAKPDTVIILDQVRLRYWPQALDVRFHPDNRDDQAQVETDGEHRFRILRPKAILDGRVYARSALSIRTAELDVGNDPERFPFVELHSDKSLHHEVLTVLTATQVNGSPQPAAPQVEPLTDGWRIHGNRLNAKLLTTRHEPQLQLIR